MLLPKLTPYRLPSAFNTTVMPDAKDSNASNQESDVANDQEDYVVRHETIEFNGPARCQSCSKENRACVVRENDKTCLFCYFVNSDCLFTRRIERSSLKKDLSWNELINPSSQPSASTSIRAIAASDTRPSKIQRTSPNGNAQSM